MSDRPHLRALADKLGILPEYTNFNATKSIVATDNTRIALLRAMGVDAGDEQSAERALKKLSHRQSASGLDPLPSRTAGRGDARCPQTPARQLRGLWANLYSLRSCRNWGVGDFGDLKNLMAWAAGVGLDFVGLNPLHALRNRKKDISPYRPVSRLFRNEIYLEIEAVPEWAQCPQARTLAASEAFRAQREKAIAADWIDYDAVFMLKRSLLRLLHAEFLRCHAAADTDRGRAFRKFVADGGETLRNFTTFVAIDESFRSQSPVLDHWNLWPAPLRDPRSPETEQQRHELQDDVGFHAFVQFELDRQLAGISEAGRKNGLAVGLFQDLAIGTSPDGCDPWAFPGLFALAAGIGAPPDDLGPAGQDWALPPIIPHRLVETGFDYWSRLVIAAFAHAGALRIDHVMGLLRQFWIPQGMDATAGAYVRFPVDDLFASLADESRRQNAIVIGEDLGTVPPGFSELLERWGVFSTRVLHFELDHQGEYLPPDRILNRAYLVVGTHDMVPLAGFAQGRDLQLRKEAGAIESDAALHQALAQRRRTHEALIRALRRENLWTDADANIADPLPLCAAVHRYLCRSPARMIGLSLDDLAGETWPVNLPGLGQERYPNWSRRMTRSLEDLMSCAQIRRSIEQLDA